MKFYSFILYLLIIILFLHYSNNIKLTVKDGNMGDNKPKTTQSSQTTLTSGYFFIQKFYPGSEPEKLIIQSQKESRKKYFQLTEQMIYYSESQSTSIIMEGNS